LGAVPNPKASKIEFPQKKKHGSGVLQARVPHLTELLPKEKTGFQLFSFQMHELKVNIFNLPSDIHENPMDCHVQQVAPSLRPSGCPLVRMRSLRCPAGFLFVL
jgi:hypothetical protein